MLQTLTVPLKLLNESHLNGHGMFAIPLNFKICIKKFEIFLIFKYFIKKSCKILFPYFKEDFFQKSCYEFNISDIELLGTKRVKNIFINHNIRLSLKYTNTFTEV